jgi:hypothetical protein
MDAAIGIGMRRTLSCAYAQGEGRGLDPIVRLACLGLGLAWAYEADYFAMFFAVAGAFAGIEAVALPKRKTPLGGAGFLIETAEGRGDLGRPSTRLLSACLVAGGAGLGSSPFLGSEVNPPFDRHDID